MREMGFEYDPSTAGSSVRFDPPDKRDKASRLSFLYLCVLKELKPISVHKRKKCLVSLALSLLISPISPPRYNHPTERT